MRDEAGRRSVAARPAIVRMVTAGWVRLERWWRAGRRTGVVLAAAASMVLAAPVPAGAVTTAASSPAGSDRAPAEVALLGVCCAVLVGVVAALVRRGRVRHWRPGRKLRDAIQTDHPPESAADTPDAPVDGAREASRPQLLLRPTLVVLAAAVVLLGGTVSAAVILTRGSHRSTDRGNAAAAASPVPGLTAATSAPAASSPPPGKHPAKSARGAVSPGPGQSPGQAGAAATAGSGSPASSGSAGSSGSSGSPGPSSPAPTLALSTRNVALALQADSPSGIVVWNYAGSFDVSAVSGPVTFTISEPAGEKNYFEVWDANVTYKDLSTGQTLTDTAQPGDPVTVSVWLPATSGFAPPYDITVNPGGATVTFTLSS
jgi:hypothetical protein